MKSNKRILLNAEPFGFGPTSAIAAFFPHLAKYFDHIAYIGSGHTLDLQTDLGYNMVYNLDELTESELKSLAQSYDVFVTAMDFGMAERMKKFGCKVVIYDALTWYRPDITLATQYADVYLPQFFLGVDSNIKKIKNKLIYPVSPIVHQPNSNNAQKKYILINLGGLQNPFWKDSDAIKYAELMIGSILMGLQDTTYEVIITSSKKIASSLPAYNIKTLSRDAMIKMLEHTKYAFMTPGLGNIYDVANHDIPTIWLPAANDSQGQQVMLLYNNNCIDGMIDWSDISDTKIDYSNTQGQVIEQINTALLNCDQKLLTKICVAKREDIHDSHTSKAHQLINQFGRDGDEQVAQHIITFTQNLSKQSHEN